MIARSWYGRKSVTAAAFVQARRFIRNWVDPECSFAHFTVSTALVTTWTTMNMTMGAEVDGCTHHHARLGCGKLANARKANSKDEQSGRLSAASLASCRRPWPLHLAWRRGDEVADNFILCWLSCAMYHGQDCCWRGHGFY